MNRIITAVLVAVSLLISACATAPSGTVDAKAALLDVKQTFLVAQSAAVLYTSLPLCGSAGASKVCSDPKIVLQIDEANTAAVKAIAAADAAVQAGAPNAVTLLAAASAAAAALNTHAQAVKP